MFTFVQGLVAREAFGSVRLHAADHQDVCGNLVRARCYVGSFLFFGRKDLLDLVMVLNGLVIRDLPVGKPDLCDLCCE